MAIVVVWVVWALNQPRVPGTVSSVTPLTAFVRFTGTQFEISNRDGFNWTDCRLEVNGRYEHQVTMIPAGATYQAGALTFAQPSGERFNPLTLKPNRLSIRCTAQGGRRTYHAEWR